MSLTKSIKATIQVELSPWRAPNFARRVTDDDSEGQGSIPVRELDDNTLEDMALAWIKHLYMNAGRTYVPFHKPVRDGGSK